MQHDATNNGRDIRRTIEWLRGNEFVVSGGQDGDITIVVKQRWLLIAECERIAELLREHGAEPQRIGATQDGIEIHGLYDPIDDEEAAAKIIVKRLDDARLFGAGVIPA